MEFVILGVILLFSGVSVIINPEFYSSRYSMVLDYNEVRYPLGIMLVAAGLFLLWSVYKKRNR